MHHPPRSHTNNRVPNHEMILRYETEAHCSSLLLLPRPWYYEEKDQESHHKNFLSPAPKNHIRKHFYYKKFFRYSLLLKMTDHRLFMHIILNLISNIFA